MLRRTRRHSTNTTPHTHNTKEEEEEEEDTRGGGERNRDVSDFIRGNKPKTQKHKYKHVALLGT